MGVVPYAATEPVLTLPHLDAREPHVVHLVILLESGMLSWLGPLLTVHLVLAPLQLHLIITTWLCLRDCTTEAREGLS